MEEQVRTSSPPLPGKGFYSMDFDALEGSYNPPQTDEEIKCSPPAMTKDVDISLEPKKEPLPAKTDIAQDDNKSLSEMEAVPKRKKSKSSSSSSKKSMAVVPSHELDASQKADAPVMSVDETAEKPAKPRKSGKKSRSIRPMSQSFDEQLFLAEQGEDGGRSSSPMMKSYHEQSKPKKKRVPKDPAAKVKEETALQAPSNMCEDSQPPATPKEHCEQEKSSAPPEKAPSIEKNAPHPKTTPDKSVSAAETCTPQSENVPPLPETTVPLVDKSAAPSKKHRARSASVTSEDGSELRPRKERSKEKVRKPKSKRSISGSKGEKNEGDPEGEEVSEKVKERKHARRRASQCDGGGGGGLESNEPPVADAEKTKSTSSPEQGQESDKSPVEKGESCMTSSHSRDSVVKLVQVLKYSQSDWNKLRQELDVHFQSQLRANDGDWSAKLAEREAHAAALEEQIRKLKLTNEDMRAVMGEFEKTIGQLQAEKEKTKNANQQSLKDVMREKDQALEDLRSVETAFSDLHRRYEKTKAVLEGFKQNEDMLKKCVQDLQNKVKKAEQKAQTVRMQAEDKLDRATEELEKVKKMNASEIARLEAALRKAHVQVESVEASLEQKLKENRELTAICDELIAKVQ